MGNDFIFVLVVITALGFDFTNGFHDTGNAMATLIATGALPPKVAVAGLPAVFAVGLRALSAGSRGPATATAGTTTADDAIYGDNPAGLILASNQHRVSELTPRSEPPTT